MYTSPVIGSIATLLGSPIVAEVANPPSPLSPALPIPAIV
jgi:hypothetical protein